MAWMLLMLTGCGEVAERSPPPWHWTDTAVWPTHDPQPTFTGPVPGNLLMISIDTLRRDHVDVAHMPFVTTLAGQGMTLDDHLTCSNWTFPSTTCVLSGATGEDMGLVPRLVEQGVERVPDGQPLLAALLRDAGFTTILVSKNSWLGPLVGNAAGYTHFIEPEGGGTPSIVQAGVDALPPEGPWFLHLHLMEPHVPYLAPDAWLEGLDELAPLPFALTPQKAHYETVQQWPDLSADERALLEAHLRVRYAGEVRWLDARLAEAWQDLSEAGLLEDTLVLLWSDHGEQFWEHGHQSHAWGLHGEETDGFALFWSSGIVPGRWAGPTASVDLLPTLLTTFGLPVPDGVTGVPLGAARPGRSRFLTSAARAGVEQAIVRNGWKLIYRWRTGEKRLYDLAADPDEGTDRYAADPAVAADLWSRLRPRVRATEGILPTEERN